MSFFSSTKLFALVTVTVEKRVFPQQKKYTMISLNQLIKHLKYVHFYIRRTAEILQLTHGVLNELKQILTVILSKLEIETENSKTLLKS